MCRKTWGLLVVADRSKKNIRLIAGGQRRLLALAIVILLIVSALVNAVTGHPGRPRTINLVFAVILTCCAIVMSAGWLRGRRRHRR